MRITSRLALGEILAVVLFVAGVIIWAVRLEGRVDTQDTKIDEVKAAQQQAITAVRQDLQYIRRRLDQALDASR